MLTHAFETWQVLRVCLHTGSRNSRSRAAIERLGTKFGGILRALFPRGGGMARSQSAPK
jgi:RimJ/RimL family protein N-acetyltransferase